MYSSKLPTNCGWRTFAVVCCLCAIFKNKLSLRSLVHVRQVTVTK